MSHQIPYVAEFECTEGHKFTAEADPIGSKSFPCPVCYFEWKQKTFPKAVQTGPSRVKQRITVMEF